MSEETRLRVSGLTKRFGNEFALSDVQFDIADDEIVALLGPSGCGKTTILRCIAGVETPDGGTIEIGGVPVENETISRPPEDRSVGMVYQNYAIWPHKSVYENVVFPLKYADHGVPSSAFESRVEEVLELVEIRDLKDEPATDLSGGQQQRTALARSLVHDPELLLMDEPLSNLDQDLRASMRYELQKLQHELGVSMLYVTHDQEEAFYLADRVLVMRAGEIVERGTPSALYRRPTSPFTREFVGQWNRFEGSLDRDESGRQVVRTKLGTFPLSSVDAVTELDATDAVSCFLRPTAIQVGRISHTDGRRIERRGTVVAEGLLGNRYEVTVRLDDSDARVVVQSEQHHQFERGEDVVLRLQTDAMKVYAASDRWT
jgi:ABC-type Fe3+/spermidine/putrescine transport system ATPase subunit